MTEQLGTEERQLESVLARARQESRGLDVARTTLPVVSVGRSNATCLPSRVTVQELTSHWHEQCLMPAVAASLLAPQKQSPGLLGLHAVPPETRPYGSFCCGELRDQLPPADGAWPGVPGSAEIAFRGWKWRSSRVRSRAGTLGLLQAP